MNKSWKISRRTMLKGLGAAVALPALDVMGPVTARAATGAESINRMAYFYFPNGIPRGIWSRPKAPTTASYSS